MSSARRLTSALVLALAIAMPANQARALDLTVEQAVQEMQYAITTEWDQKDPAKQREIYREFSRKIEALRAAGVSQADLVSEMKRLALTKQQAKDLDAVAKYAVAHRLSSAESTALLVKTMQGAAAVEGTSWNPSGNDDRAVVLGIVIGVVILAAIVVGVIACHNSDSCRVTHENTNPGIDPDPFPPTDPGPGGCYEDQGGLLWCPPIDTDPPVLY